jgi:hypothetical protein
MLSVTYAECHLLVLYAEYCYAECRDATNKLAHRIVNSGQCHLLITVVKCL